MIQRLRQWAGPDRAQLVRRLQPQRGHPRRARRGEGRDRAGPEEETQVAEAAGAKAAGVAGVAGVLTTATRSRRLWGIHQRGARRHWSAARSSAGRRQHPDSARPQAPPMDTPTLASCLRGTKGPEDSARPMPAGPTQAGPTQAGPMPAGPTQAGPPPASPTQAGPMPAGPTPAGQQDRPLCLR
jgi:hypothetical protein